MNVFVSSIFIIALITVAFPSNLLAHQNGCHRWHSCPSDTESYICGDLGYDTYCGDTAYYEEPDYGSEGHSNGHDHAGNDRVLIVQNASSNGDDEGYRDGRSDYYEDNSPDASIICEKKFIFESYSPEEYQEAYHESYKEACTESYDESYGIAYTVGYQRGQAELIVEKQNAESEDELSANTSDASGSSGWFWSVVIGGGAIWYVASAMSGSRKRRGL